MNIYLLQNEERRGIKEMLVFQIQKKKKEKEKNMYYLLSKLFSYVDTQ